MDLKTAEWTAMLSQQANDKFSIDKLLKKDEYVYFYVFLAVFAVLVVMRPPFIMSHVNNNVSIIKLMVCSLIGVVLYYFAGAYIN